MLGWQDVIGHELPKRFLRSAIEKGRVAHAYAFVGPTGVGKATLARVFIQALLCRQGKKGDGGEENWDRPCGECRECRRVARDVHPDVRWIQPDGDVVRIEQIRSLQAELALKPYEAIRKCAVIDQADKMTTAAQNALLKTLEEPAGETVLVLVAANPSALMPTVRSRCQLLRFQPLPLPLVAAELEKRGVEPGQAHLVAAITEGRLGAALEALERDIVATRNRVADWIEELGSPMGLRAAVRVGQALDDDRDSIERYLSFFLLWLRDMVLVKEGAAEAVANQDAMDRLRASARKCSTEGLAKAMRAVDEARRRLKASANVRLALDVMLANVQRSLT